MKDNKNRVLFQFTPLREGRPATVIGGITALLAFQFTPLREGRLAVLGKRADTRRISIHAPPRGATSTMHRIMSMDIISIHAPPRGATYFTDSTDIEQLFQFTPLREGRRRLGRQR